MPGNHRQLHRAQVRIYGWLLCQKLELSKIYLALVYFDVVNQKETVLSETQDADSLKRCFENQCEYFLHWAQQELTHRKPSNCRYRSSAISLPVISTASIQSRLLLI